MLFRTSTTWEITRRNGVTYEVINSSADIVLIFYQVYNMFHRVNMHEMLMDSAVGENHPGTPGTLKVDHKCTSINHEAGLVTFENGVQAKHDLVIGADGIGVSHISLEINDNTDNRSPQ